MTDPHAHNSDEQSVAPEMEGDAEQAQAAPAANDDAAAQIAALKDQLLRAMAETENTRRRTQKEIDDTRKYAVGNFAKEMLNIADNFERALTSLPKDTGDATIKNLVVGIEATGRQLQAVLERFGIKKLEPLGEVFDPNLHRAMMEVDDAEKPAGTVVQVLQSGYVIHDRLLREALVSVTKGGAPATKVDKSA